MEIHPGKGVLIEEKFANTRKPSHQGVWGKFPISDGYITRRKNKKPTDHVPKGNTQQRSTPDASILHQQTGAEQRAGRERERKRETERNYPAKSPNLRSCRATYRTKDWANTREALTGCGPAHPPPETGARRAPARARRGKLDPRKGIPYQTANRLPVSNQRLEILDGWHPPGGSQPEISSPEEIHGTPSWARPETEQLGLRRW